MDESKNAKGGASKVGSNDGSGVIGVETNVSMIERSSMSSRERNWVRGYNGEFRKEELPSGVCNTVYYITKDGIRKHFTPGLAPKKRIRARQFVEGQMEPPIAEEVDREEAAIAADDDAEEIEIPEQLH